MHSQRIHPARLLFSRDGVICVAWIIVQQLVVAASTVFIIRLMESVTRPNGQISLGYLVLFVASLVLVYVPNALSTVYLDKAALASFRAYIALFCKTNAGLATLAHRRVKEVHEAWVTNEAMVVYREATSVLYQGLSTFLNAALSILAISALLAPALILWYLAAALVLCVSHWMFKSLLAQTSRGVQTTRQSIANVLLSIWDNVCIGNSHNLGNWQRAFNSSVDIAEKAVVRYNLLRALISSLTVVLALLLVATGVWRYLSDNLDNSTRVAALLVTLPRQLQVIQSIFQFFGSVLEWHGSKARLAGLDTPLALNVHDAGLSHVHWEQISVSDGGQEVHFPTLDHFITHFTGRKGGRFTFRGPNGAGKSTLLAYLVQQTGESSFYLPTGADLRFNDGSITSASDGQRMMRALEEMTQVGFPDFIILDEWDANLDPSNVALLNEKLDHIAQSHVLLEVRHRQSNPVISNGCSSDPVPQTEELL